jgi:hypothetical protein
MILKSTKEVKQATGYWCFHHWKLIGLTSNKGRLRNHAVGSNLQQRITWDTCTLCHQQELNNLHPAAPVSTWTKPILSVPIFFVRYQYDSNIQDACLHLNPSDHHSSVSDQAPAYLCQPPPALSFSYLCAKNSTHPHPPKAPESLVRKTIRKPHHPKLPLPP